MSDFEWEMGTEKAQEKESLPDTTAMLAALSRMHKSLDWISRYSTEIDVRTEARAALRSSIF